MSVAIRVDNLHKSVRSGTLQSGTSGNDGNVVGQMVQDVVKKQRREKWSAERSKIRDWWAKHGAGPEHLTAPPGFSLPAKTIHEIEAFIADPQARAYYTRQLNFSGKTYVQGVSIACQTMVGNINLLPYLPP